MSEIVIRGTRLNVRSRAAVEMVERAAQLLTDPDDRALLASPAAQMSLCFDDLPPEQAERVAHAVVIVSGQMKGEYGPVGAPPDDVEIAAQLTAVGMLVGAAYPNGSG
jgi:hypothetical protein